MGHCKYCIEFTLPGKGSISSSKFIQSMSDVLIGFEDLNKAIVTGISSEIEVVSYIEDIENGSIRFWLKDVFKNKISDDHIRDLSSSIPTLPFFLIKAKKLIVTWLEEDKPDKEKDVLLRPRIMTLFDDVRNPDHQVDFWQKEKWDENGTKKAASKIINAANNMPKVMFIDNCLGERRIIGSYTYNPERISFEDCSREITAHISLLCMRKITTGKTKKWEFLYGGRPIKIDVSACVDSLINMSFKPQGCIMKVRMSVCEKQINESGKTMYKNEYTLTEIISINHEI